MTDFFKKIICIIFHLLTSVIPKEKNLWIFIGWNKSSDGEIFADNTKYLFLEASTDASIKPVWISSDNNLISKLKENGYNSIQRNSLLGFWHRIRAQIVIIDAYLPKRDYCLIGGSKIVQLLHGKGLKKSGYGNEILEKNDYIIVPSKEVLEMLQEKFKKNAKIFISGFPRTDVFYKEIAGMEIGLDGKTLSKIKKYKEDSKKIILYAPTFRRGLKIFNWEERLNTDDLNEYLKTQDIHLIINLHQKYRDNNIKRNYSNIEVIPNQDIYPLMKYFDLLITDYSSIFADFLLFDKPLIFFADDLENYKKEEGLLKDYKNFAPGKIVTEKEDLPMAITEIMNGIDDYKEIRRIRLKEYKGDIEKNSSQKIVGFLKEDLGKIILINLTSLS